VDDPQSASRECGGAIVALSVIRYITSLSESEAFPNILIVFAWWLDVQSLAG